MAVQSGGKSPTSLSNDADVSVLDAYTGRLEQAAPPAATRRLTASCRWISSIGWYDLIVTVAGDPTFKYRLAGHVETGADSFSDPAMGGLVNLKD